MSLSEPRVWHRDDPLCPMKNAIYIGRPTKWGNPYSHLPNSGAQHHVETREQAVDAYRDWLRQRVRDGEPGLIEALASLHGQRLGCYCYPEACHGDVLAEAAAWAVEQSR